MKKYKLTWQKDDKTIFITNICKSRFVSWDKTMNRFAKNNSMDNHLSFTILDLTRLY